MRTVVQARARHADCRATQSTLTDAADSQTNAQATKKEGSMTQVREMRVIEWPGMITGAEIAHAWTCDVSSVISRDGTQHATARFGGKQWWLTWMGKKVGDEKEENILNARERHAAR